MPPLPRKNPVRIEISKGSSLPAKLPELGYPAQYVGTGTRIAASITPVDVIAIKLVA